MPFASTKGYRDWLARMAAVPTLVDQAIALMTEGVRNGNVPPKVLMERVPAQIAAQIVEEPAQSPFYRPFTKFPDAVPEADRKALAADAQRTISEKNRSEERRVGQECVSACGTRWSPYQ